MELDKAFEFAVILAWDDLMKASQARSVRVEYQGKPGTSLDHRERLVGQSLGLPRSGVRLLDVGFFGSSKRGMLQERTRARISWPRPLASS